jgi:lysophospholipase L1-like esterase
MIKLKEILFNVCIFLTFVVIVLMVFEVFLRTFNFTPHHRYALNSFHRSDPYIGWKGHPNYKGIFKTSVFRAFIENGSDGYRKKLSDVVPREDATKIAFMGDSFAWGWGVSQGELFSDYLQDLMGKNYNIKNFGINTFATVQYKIQLEREILSFQPEYVGMLFYGNDFHDNLESRNNNRPYCKVTGDQILLMNYPIQNPIGGLYRSYARKSYVLTFLNYYHGVFKEYLKVVKNKFRRIIKNKNNKKQSISRKEILVFREYLWKINEICKANGLNFFMVYVPTAKNIIKPENKRLNYLETVRRACNDYQIDLIDLTPEFVKGITGNKGEPYYFTNDPHWTRSGHMLAANSIYEYLKNMEAKE